MKSDYVFFEGHYVPALTSVTLQTRPRETVPAIELSPEVGEFLTAAMAPRSLPASNYRARALARRIPACLRLLGAATPAQGLQQLRQKPELVDSVVGTVLLGVTEFFRDAAVFEHLRFSVLPWLLAHDQRLRVWSAACSEGQELYSIALLLAEDGRLHDCELVGTDCRREAIHVARAGVFDAESVAVLDSHWRRNFFTISSVHATIASALVRATKWKVANLFEGVERGPWHLILWRNMAIYLEHFAAEELWWALCRELLSGGYLITGKADHPPAGLPLKRIAPCIYQKVDSRS
ncbi:MAG: CheR family methyltransferase [Opitutus sp.]